MKRIASAVVYLFVAAASTAVYGQAHGTTTPQPQPQPQSQSQNPTAQQVAARNATREKLRTVLETAGPKMNVVFRQSDKNPYNFIGVLKQGLKNSSSMEILIVVGTQDTIHFRIYPRYNDAYINVDKARNSVSLMRQIVRFSDQNFLFWGMDETADVFAGYNFTLESGFPEASIRIVLSSIANQDQYVGKMRPSIDGTEGL